MSLHTVGIGASIPSGGLLLLPAAKTLADLKSELVKAIDHYGIPPEARICRPAPGSIYLFELTWIEEEMNSTRVPIDMATVERQLNEKIEGGRS